MQRESTRQAWVARLQEQSQSNLNIKAWCVREGIATSSFHYWRKRLAEPSALVTEFIALPMPGRHTQAMLELQTPDGYVIRLSSQQQVHWVSSILAALR